MDVKELRIGNYVFTGENDLVLCFHSAYGLCNAEVNPDRFRPIPLTEEWLLKFGFELRHYGGYNTAYNNFEIDIFLNEETGYVQELQLSSTKISGAYPNPSLCQYVHQLQNLYKALFGNELKLNDHATH